MSLVENSRQMLPKTRLMRSQVLAQERDPKHGISGCMMWHGTPRHSHPHTNTNKKGKKTQDPTEAHLVPTRLQLQRHRTVKGPHLAQ